MKLTNSFPRAGRGFTLIELIIVIGIIAVLAAMIFPAASTIKKSATLRKARTELQQVVTAIESYKSRTGFYPPDNPKKNSSIYAPATPGNAMLSQLYFELTGTKQTAAGYEALEGSSPIPTAEIEASLGVDGFMNCTRAGGDEATPAQNFLKTGLKAGQYTGVPNADDRIKVLTSSINWPPPSKAPWKLLPMNEEANPWRYNSSSPTNNTSSYDLWVDVVIGKRVYRISNWTENNVIVYP